MATANRLKPRVDRLERLIASLARETRQSFREDWPAQPEPLAVQPGQPDAVGRLRIGQHPGGLSQILHRIAPQRRPHRRGEIGEVPCTADRGDPPAAIRHALHHATSERALAHPARPENLATRLPAQPRAVRQNADHFPRLRPPADQFPDLEQRHLCGGQRRRRLLNRFERQGGVEYGAFFAEQEQRRWLILATKSSPGRIPHWSSQASIPASRSCSAIASTRDLSTDR